MSEPLLLYFQMFGLSELLFNELKHIFTYAAKRAYPIIRKIFESCSRSNSAIRIAYFGVVNPLTYSANVLFHLVLSLIVLLMI